MKKLIIILIILVIVTGLSFWVWQNLKGVLPIIKKPPQDIAELIEQSTEGPKGTVNKTGLPLELPSDFSISIFAKDLGKARVIKQDPKNRLVVSLIDRGKVVALPDENQDGLTDKTVTVADNLYNPHGLLFRCLNEQCHLYIAETNQVAVYDYDVDTMKASNKRKIIDLPDDGGHFTRTLDTTRINGQEKLLISVGSSCNVCYEKDWRRAAILMSDFDGNNLEIFASGLRNAVFITNHPLTKEIWATDNGRDWLGDNLPPDEINIVKPNKNYGWPVCYGQNIHDTDFDKNVYIRNPCDDKESLHIDVAAHSAVLGIDFFGKGKWPKEYQYNALVAYHGSWNRSVPTGYKVVRYFLDEAGNYLGQEDFISGWLIGDNALGRPVDILILDEGIIYISDDKAGVIYQLKYNN